MMRKNNSVTNRPVLNLSERRVRTSVTEYMKLQNLTKTNMARLTGYAYPHFLRLLNGSMPLTSKAAIRLLYACECRIAKSQKA